MGSKEIITAATEPVFRTRVAYIAIKVAQNVAAENTGTANHDNRVKYANRVFTGQDKVVDLALHVVASNGTIAAKLEADGGDGVPDSDIEFALSTIWDARSNAFA